MHVVRWAILASTLLWLFPGSARALEAFDGRVQLHGAVSEEIRVIANGYRVRDHNWFLSKMATKLSLELEVELFPDGIGPFDIVEFFGRLDVQYDCVYEHACHMARQWNYFGDDARRFPENLANGRSQGTTGVLPDPLDPVRSIQPEQRLVSLIEIPPFSTLLALGNPTAIANTFGDLFDAKFSTKYIRGSIEPRIFGIGPINPEFFIDSSGLLADRDVVTTTTDAMGNSLQPLRPESPSLFNPTRAFLAREGQFDNPDVNFTENELAWNRGAHQQQTKELREAYLDITMLDGRLQLRLGKQITRWGKTELFRGGSPDQFNPQDLAISNLPSFEDSLIALWQARAIYSFYDVGPFEDLRVELVANLDHFEPSDLGDCGEPYTVWLVCGKQLGLLGHGFSGIGIAGEVRPQNWYNSSSGLEFGARVEFRLGRFSVALTDFYGYDDFPTADFFYEYSRNVDPLTGRPRVVGSTGVGTCVTGTEASCLRPETPIADGSGNRTLFDTICSATLGFELPGEGISTILGDVFDDTCAISLFSAPADLPMPFETVPLLFSELVADGDFWNANPLCALVLCAGALGKPTVGMDGFQALATIPLHFGGATDFDPATIPGSTVTGSFITAGVVGGLSAFLSDEQEALLGCGEAYFQTSDACHRVGVDLFNAEGSVFFQRFPQYEGGGQPLQAPIATRFVPGTGVVTLPGARSPFAIDFSQPSAYWYNPAVDGCVINLNHPFFGQVYPGVDLVGTLTAAGIDTTICDDMVDGGMPVGVPIPDGVAPGGAAFDRTQFDDTGGFYTPEQIQAFFPNELAIVSENVARLLAGIGAAAGEPGCAAVVGDPLFLSTDSLLRCSFLTAFFNTLGAQRPELRAGGNGRFGRRDFSWHSGSEIALFYERRNVFGVGVDFVEDYTKTSWGVEFTWLEDAPYVNTRTDRGFSREDTLNLTISIDRPTFINFLNANRTIFFNAQFFLRYIPNYKRLDTFAVDGPASLLATLTAFTGFWQDRLLTFVTLVHEVESNSGGQIFTMSYRITEAFSVTVGLSNFFGDARRARWPDRPPVARFHGFDYTERSNFQGVSPIAERDEIFFTIRHTF